MSCSRSQEINAMATEQQEHLKIEQLKQHSADELEHIEGREKENLEGWIPTLASGPESGRLWKKPSIIAAMSRLRARMVRRSWATSSIGVPALLSPIPSCGSFPLTHLRK